MTPAHLLINNLRTFLEIERQKRFRSLRGDAQCRAVGECTRLLSDLKELEGRLQTGEDTAPEAMPAEARQLLEA